MDLFSSPDFFLILLNYFLFLYINLLVGFYTSGIFCFREISKGQKEDFIDYGDPSIL